MEVRLCRWCGLPFEQNRVDKVFCTSLCAHKYRRSAARELNPLPVVRVKCRECGNEFDTDDNRRKFCSKKCKKKMDNRKDKLRRRELVLKEREEHPRYCKFCGEQLPVESSLRQVFCGYVCGYRWKNRGQKAPDPKPCAKCGVIFSPRDARQKNCTECSRAMKTSPHSPALKRVGRRKPTKAVSLIATEQAARAAGMSYGKYQAMLYLKGVTK